jgi:hypothetical protein
VLGNGSDSTATGPLDEATVDEPFGIVVHPRTGDWIISSKASNKVLRVNVSSQEVGVPSKNGQSQVGPQKRGRWIGGQLGHDLFGQQVAPGIHFSCYNGDFCLPSP